ncbi:MAG TPA: DUF433 domain-containing protein [Pyrinomonadaceae bacterium]|nr:DUF433 domain-containing protein [Pyrinomonadaceae bacterium]
MSVIVSTSELRLEKDDAGVLRVGNTRIPLDTIIFAFNEGATPEEIVWRYPTLSLVEVYAAISYYLQNREEVKAYLKEREEKHAEIKAEAEKRFSPKGIRERLLARQNNK